MMASRKTSHEMKRVGYFHIELVLKRSESDINIDLLYIDLIYSIMKEKRKKISLSKENT